VDSENWLVRGDLVADLNQGFDTDGGVDGVAFGFASAAEFDDLEADGFSIDRFDPARFTGVVDIYLNWGELPVFGIEDFG